MSDVTIGPLERFGVGIVGTDVAHDLAFEIVSGPEDAASDQVTLDLREADFDLVEPGRVGWCVVDSEVSLHSTPTYSSWLNQVENWFSKVQRHVIARGIFESVTDLRRKLMRYIKAYNKTATPLRWTYSNPTNRIAA